METDPFEELQRLDELSRLADNASATKFNLPTSAEVSRWVQLFKYAPHEANALLIAHRLDIDRTPTSDEHWELVREEREKAGYDREAYEHSLLLKDVLKSQSTVVTDKEGKRWTLYRLSGVLESEENVRGICGVEEALKVTKGEGEDGRETDFVWVDAQGSVKVERWVAEWGVLGKGNAKVAKA
ncbi:hypothetical protein BKA61DRAFT_160743 [Leptodontidium sp. MPI-SDFR-AT-0119]|nr:hypothetical protein BKA61DRAFT_160743 [Leptodontidium sp. MPI-SDFR-AT-0119]